MLELEEIKLKFKNAMSALDGDRARPKQIVLTHMVRIFCMGYLSGFSSGSSSESYSDAMRLLIAGDEICSIMRIGWQADESWQWWK